MPDQGDKDRAARIVQRCRSYGIQVYEQSGCYDSRDTWSRVPTRLIDHHDASTRSSGEWGSLGYILSGRIANWQVARCLDGVPKVALVAAGANCPHAGVGGPWGEVPRDSMNSWGYGVESANDGTEAYTAAAIYAKKGLYYAIEVECGRAHGTMTVEHAEWGNIGHPYRKNDSKYGYGETPNGGAGGNGNWMRGQVVNFVPNGGGAAVPALFNPGGAIYADWKERSLAGPYGNPTTAETANGEGSCGVHQWFQNNSVAWWCPEKITQRWNTSWTHGSINTKYVNTRGWAHGPDGLPTSNEMLTHDGRGVWQKFENSIAVWHPSIGEGGAFFVKGGILTEYMNIGGTASPLGYPYSEEAEVAPGVVSQKFVHITGDNHDFVGQMIWSAATGAKSIYGLFETLWTSYGGVTSLYGLPTTHQAVASDDTRVVYQYTQHGAFVWRSTEGVAYAVTTQILDAWLLFGGWAGKLGMPIDQPLITGATQVSQKFEHGDIAWDGDRKLWEITVDGKHFELSPDEPAQLKKLASVQKSALKSAKIDVKKTVIKSVELADPAQLINLKKLKPAV